mmetsp:Transcript_45180/g.51911  ORF Transcript_45180/g.51911 Transcript_45180/m.51911 type:complete len:129 (-) Transcript_45180:762-1148(-)
MILDISICFILPIEPFFLHNTHQRSLFEQASLNRNLPVAIICTETEKERKKDGIVKGYKYSGSANVKEVLERASPERGKTLTQSKNKERVPETWGSKSKHRSKIHSRTFTKLKKRERESFGDKFTQKN